MTKENKINKIKEYVEKEIGWGVIILTIAIFGALLLILETYKFTCSLS